MHLQGTTHQAWHDYGLIFDQMLKSDDLKVYEEDIEAVKSGLNLGSLYSPDTVSITSKYIVAFFNTYLKGGSEDEITSIDDPSVTLEIVTGEQ